ncbi:MAG: nucleotidyltransferase domain-containing protein [Ignavibacteriae bacterium]|nr:nucleotidyltransferase domain-containing protein [Ignavibacteriota bacterium]
MSQQDRTLESITSAISTFAESNGNIAAAYLFGSAVPQRLTPESDIDIGLLFERRPSAGELLQLQAEFTDALGIEADIVDLEGASPILGMQVLKTGVRVFTRNQSKANEFFVRTINEYDDLKRMRKPIEDNILNGRIYAR